MRWRPDFCAGGRCILDVNAAWTSGTVLQRCTAHAAFTFQQIWDESKLKERGRAQAALTLGILIDGQPDGNAIAYRFDATRKIILSAPGRNVNTPTRNTLNTQLATIDARLSFG